MEIHIPELDKIMEMLTSMRKELDTIKELLEDKNGSSKMTLKEAAAYSRISTDILRQDIRQGRRHPQYRDQLYLRAEVTRGGQYRLLKKDLDEFYSKFNTLPRKSARRIPY